MNRQHILSRLGRQHSILYSNGPWTIWDRKLSEYQRAPMWGAFLKQDNVHVDHPPRLLLSYPSKSRWDRTVRALACARWRRQLESLPGEGLIAYVTHPDYADHAIGVRPDRIVYAPFDLFSATPGWTRDQGDREERLLRACDVVITVSDAIKSRLEPKTAAPVYCVPNGVDAEAFAAGSLEAAPDDIAEIPRPRIGYVGSLNRKVDFGLVERLASSNPAWHFVFVGASFGHNEDSPSPWSVVGDSPTCTSWG